MKLKLRRQNQDDDAACVNVCRGKCGARRSRRRRSFDEGSSLVLSLRAARG